MGLIHKLYNSQAGIYEFTAQSKKTKKFQKILIHRIAVECFYNII